MTCTCDVCGAKASAVYTGREWLKPGGWFEKMKRFSHGFESSTVLQACSRACLDKLLFQDIQEHNKEVCGG